MSRQRPKCASPVQLKVKIVRQQAAREQKLRRKNLTKYIPNAAAAVFKVLQSMAQAPAVGSKRRRLQAEEDILEPVTRGETVEATLAQRLTEYVERIDTDMVSTVPTGSMHQAVRLCLVVVLGQPEGQSDHRNVLKVGKSPSQCARNWRFDMMHTTRFLPTTTTSYQHNLVTCAFQMQRFK